MARRCIAVWGLLILLASGAGGSAVGSDCTNTSVGLIPLNELGGGLYLGQYQGGLYPNGLNQPPAIHSAEGRERALAIEPLDTSGNPNATGHYVLLSIGMSNTTQEFCSAGSGEPCDAWTFMGQAAAHPAVKTDGLYIVNGARGGQAISSWDAPADANYDRVRDEVLTPRGLTEAQVQILWIKQAIPGPSASLPAPNADAFNVLAGLGNIVRSAKTRYPNLRMAFFSSRIYAGYASTALNPEPYAYESAFGVKWLIEAQIEQMAGAGVDPAAGDLSYATGAAPWLAWGPYLWADGLTPRADGLVWTCADMQSDGTHPAQSGEEKVGAMLLQFMLNSKFTRPWFTTCWSVDPDGSGELTMADIPVFVDVLLGLDSSPMHVFGSDRDCDGRVTGTDIAPLVEGLIGE